MERDKSNNTMNSTISTTTGAAVAGAAAGEKKSRNGDMASSNPFRQSQKRNPFRSTYPSRK